MILPVISSTLYILCILLGYTVFLTGIPILAFSDSFRNHWLPHCAYYLGVSKMGVDQYLQTIAAATFFVYFALNSGADMMYILRSLYATWFGGNVTSSTTSTTTTTETTTTITITTVTQSILPAPPLFASGITTKRPSRSPSTLSQRLSRAYQQIALFYPAFITSTCMIWANTNAFDTFNTAFVMIQALFLLLMPLTFAIPLPLLGHLNSVGYRCAILWTLVYALYPQAVGDWMYRRAYEHLCENTDRMGCPYMWT